MGCMLNATFLPLYPQETDTVPIIQEAGWAPWTVWTGEENGAPTGIRSPDRPARGEYLYQLSYPGRRESRYVLYFTDKNQCEISLKNLTKSKIPLKCVQFFTSYRQCKI